MLATMQDPRIDHQMETAICQFHCITIPAIKEANNLIKGAFFQK